VHARGPPSRARAEYGLAPGAIGTEEEQDPAGQHHLGQSAASVVTAQHAFKLGPRFRRQTRPIVTGGAPVRRNCIRPKLGYATCRAADRTTQPAVDLGGGWLSFDCVPQIGGERPCGGGTMLTDRVAVTLTDVGQ
jgi:hypothetical protein